MENNPNKASLNLGKYYLLKTRLFKLGYQCTIHPSGILTWKGTQPLTEKTTILEPKAFKTLELLAIYIELLEENKLTENWLAKSRAQSLEIRERWNPCSVTD